MGSFRLGEILAKSENYFNVHETLLWKDVKFMKDGSIQIHNKIPKTRTKNGEYISLFHSHILAAALLPPSLSSSRYRLTLTSLSSVLSMAHS
jgi:hypothetical protein